MSSSEVVDGNRPEVDLSIAGKQQVVTAEPQRRTLIFLRRLYLPLLSVLLTFLIGNWLAALSAQDVEQKMVEHTEHEMAPVAGLSTSAVAEAHTVLGATDLEPRRTHLLFLGDSQAFSRPDAPPGSLTSAQWLQVMLWRQDPNAVGVRVGAMPGMDVAEMLLRSIVAAEQQPRQADIVVVDLVLGELRELGIRNEMSSKMQSPAAQAALQSLVADNGDLPDAVKLLRPLLNSAGQTKSAIDQPLATRMEDALQRRADAWPFFAQREAVIRQALLGYAQWQHRLLHITSDTALPTPPVPYRTNLEMLELLMRYARSRGLHLVLFFGPVRDLRPNPDAPADLARMYRDATELCRRYGATCLNYSNVLPEGEQPEGLWAEYAANSRGAYSGLARQHDFYHFTEAGHKLLAEKLMSDAGPSFVQWSKPAGGQP
jgi:hypothetical protein